MIRRVWRTIVNLLGLLFIGSFAAFAQNGDAIEVTWNSAVLTILITAIMVAGIILYEWVRLRKTE